jgi:hypothetical protein
MEKPDETQDIGKIVTDYFIAETPEPRKESLG